MTEKIQKKQPIKERRISILSFMKEEEGMGTVEIILIIVVLIGLVVIFKKQMTNIVNDLFNNISNQTKNF